VRGTLEPSEGPPEGSPDRLRISDEERRQVVDRLRQHCAEGRITLDEFSERAGQVYAARTRGELTGVLADLPEPVPVAAPTPAVARPQRHATRWVVGVMGGGHSKGRWRPDEQTTALAIMGGCTVDLRQAEIDRPVIAISAIAIMGGVDIIVPEGIAVEMSGIAIMGGKDCRVRDVTPLPGTPVIRVNAFAFWGGVTVRTKRERPRELRAQERIERAQAQVERHRHLAERHAARAMERAARYAPIVEEVLGSLQQGMRPRPPAAPDGTVTILFSDIEDFTGITERLGDLKAQDVLHQHNQIVRRELAAYEGYEVKSQGDSFMLAFASARRALNCAVHLQRDLAQWSVQHPEQPLRVRMGLHTGEAIREQDDLFGRTVILASRIAAEARGGEILVSSLLKELTESSGEFCFSPGREVALKGLSRPQVVHEVDWSGALLG
jgi:class 3 adenylate cyclase